MATQKSPWIIDAEAATFQTAVIERSRELPVVVDFWAEWCQPCRLLGPVLEKLTAEYDGKFLLVKANVDQLQDIAGQFGVQSIPAVFALRGGELFDMFVGMLPEPQLRSWIDRLVPKPAELLVSEGSELAAASDWAGAADKFRAAAQLDPRLAAAKIGLAESLLALGQADAARTIVTELAERGFLEPAAARLQARLDLALGGEQTGGVAACRAAADADPHNLELKLKFAEALAAAGDYAEALETALGLIAQDRKRFGEPARKIMVDIFYLLPADSELTSAYRRKLSTALY